MIRCFDIQTRTACDRPPVLYVETKFSRHFFCAEHSRKNAAVIVICTKLGRLPAFDLSEMKQVWSDNGNPCAVNPDWVFGGRELEEIGIND